MGSLNNFFRRSNLQQSSSTIPFVADETGIESGVPLQIVQRASTETTRRNGFHQSVAPDRATRIMEDIMNRNYPCSICTEVLIQENAGEYCMWQCEICYNVFHHLCIKAWAEPNFYNILGGIRQLFTWTCPFCSAARIQRPKATCWCGKRSSNNTSIRRERVERPNSCPALCGKVVRCIHRRFTTPCTKQCHPGPCYQPCMAACAGLPETAHEKTNLWRLFERFQERRPGSMRILFIYTFVIIGTYVCIVSFLIKHSRWWSQPWKYHNFTEVSGKYETLTLSIVGFLIVLPTLVAIITIWTSFLGSFFTLLLNLDDRSTKSKLKACTKCSGWVVLGLVVVACVFTPIIGLIEGPRLAWYQQFRHSCRGLETRIRMDEQIVYQSGSEGGIKPTQVLIFNSLVSPNKNQTFYLGAHFEPKPGSREPYQYYHRLGGLTNNGHNLAIDIDMDRHKWRLLLLSGADTANKWLAELSSNQEQGRLRLPQLSKVTQTLIRNGTFMFSNAVTQYIHIPELDFMIGNIADFLHRCEYEPFMRVYNSLGLSHEEIRHMGNQEWSSYSEDRVVMRTASFGHGRKGLDMCLREGPIQPQTLWNTDKNSITDELLVPLAIISTLRLQLWEGAKRPLTC